MDWVDGRLRRLMKRVGRMKYVLIEKNVDVGALSKKHVPYPGCRYVNCLTV